MMKINGKNYKMPELNFNAMCNLEDMGVSITSLDKKPMATIRGFIALAIGDPEKAGKELEEHIVNGGTLDDIISDITKAVSESGFFQALSAKQPESNPTSQSKKAKPTQQ